MIDSNNHPNNHPSNQLAANGSLTNTSRPGARAGGGGRNELEDVLRFLRRRWWVIALVTVLAGGAAFAVSSVQKKKYTASASILFQTSQATQLAAGEQSPANSPSSDPTLMATNIQLLSDDPQLPAATARAVGQGVTPAIVSSAIKVSQQGQTDVAQVSATTHSPALSAAIASAFVRQFLDGQNASQRAAVQQALSLVNKQVGSQSKQQLASATGQALLDRAESLQILAKLQNSNASLLGVATPPSSPSSPKIKRNTVLGLLLGLLLGLGVAFLLERLDRRMKTVEDLEDIYRLPLLAAVPYSKSYAVSPSSDPNGHRGEREVFSMLRAYLRYFNVDREIKTLLVVSGASGDGKTTIARNLAQASQEIGTRTLLIEADLRRPDLARIYGVEPAPGLSELLAGSVHPYEATQAVPIETRINGTTSEVKLHVIVGGQPPPNPAELVESQAMDRVIAGAAENYDLVVIDTAPLSVVSDAVPLLSKVDGVVVVSQLGKNTRDAAASLKDRLVGVSAPVLGVVANGVDPKGKAGYRYGGYYESEAPGGAKREPERSTTASG